MAEMLIDGAKLDACNTAEADAIRAKTGGTDPIPYDYANNKGFADAIAAIETGGGSALNWFLDYMSNNLSGDVVFPKEVKILESPASQSWNFYQNAKIISLTFPNTIENWKSGRLQNVSNLKWVKLALKSNTIPQDAFYSCAKLEKVEFMEECGVMSFPIYTFENLGKLGEIVIKANRVITASSSNFIYKCANYTSGGSGKIYVPDVLVNDYKSATNWSLFADFIYPLSSFAEV